MSQLSINIVKDTKINDLVCSPNVIVLAKQSESTNQKTGDVSTRVRYIEVCKVEKTDSLTIVQSLLKYIVAEFLVCNDLEKDFSKSNIKQRKLFSQFLSGNIIYRTNSDGKIANALVSEVPLRQTALNVKDYHTITTCKPENLKAAIFQHAKAIRSQCAYIGLIKDKAENIDKEAEKAAELAAKKEAERLAKAAQKAEKVETSPAPAKTAKRRTVTGHGIAPAAIAAAPAQ